MVEGFSQLFEKMFHIISLCWSSSDERGLQELSRPEIEIEIGDLS